jgi:serine/threonine-protein kinase
MRAGDLVVANVRLERLLSEGGMGSVWVAQHLTLNTQVAVKFMGADTAEKPDAIARFKQEASAAAQIKSPHIVQVFDNGVTSEGIPYIVMELLHGEDLDHRLDRGTLSVGDTLVVIRHLCKALGRAHQQGIVHRDIKPANIFLVETDGDIFVKVLDFGIAKRAVEDDNHASKTQSGTMLGTPSYMSPEQMMGSKGVDARCDLWAAGVVAYKCLTGCVPFDGETIGALAVSVNAGMFLPVTARVPGLPLALDDWFARALARSPAARFQTAKEMADAFATAVPKELHSIRPGSGPESVALPPTDRPTMDLRPGKTPPLALVSPAARRVPPPSARIRALDAIREEPKPPRNLTLPIVVVLALAIGGGATAWVRSRSAMSVASSPAAAEPVSTQAAPAATAPPSAPPPSSSPPAPTASALPRVLPEPIVDVADSSSVAPSSTAPRSGAVAPAHTASSVAGPRRAGAADSASHRVPFTVLAVPELPQIAGSSPSPSPRADAGSGTH